MTRFDNSFMHIIILNNPIRNDSDNNVSESIINLVTESTLDSNVESSNCFSKCFSGNWNFLTIDSLFYVYGNILIMI